MWAFVKNEFLAVLFISRLHLKSPFAVGLAMLGSPSISSVSAPSPAAGCGEAPASPAWPPARQPPLCPLKFNLKAKERFKSTQGCWNFLGEDITRALATVGCFGAGAK